MSCSMCWSACVAERAQQNMTNSTSRPARPIIHVTISFTSFPEICVIVSFGIILMPKGQRHIHTAEPADRRLRRMVSTVVSKGNCSPIFIPDPFLSRFPRCIFRARHAECIFSARYLSGQVIQFSRYCEGSGLMPFPSLLGFFKGVFQAICVR